MQIAAIDVVLGEEEHLDIHRLFQVWFDSNCGIGEPHWWWDDDRAAWLEYSIYLPKSFLEPGGAG